MQTTTRKPLPIPTRRERWVRRLYGLCEWCGADGPGPFAEPICDACWDARFAPAAARAAARASEIRARAGTWWPGCEYGPLA